MRQLIGIGTRWGMRLAGLCLLALLLVGRPGQVQAATVTLYTSEPLDKINDAFDLMHEGKSIRSVVIY